MARDDRTTIIARHLTAGGATLTVEEIVKSDLWHITYEAACSGCKAGTTETTATELARPTALLWAKRHAAGCRRSN